MKKFFWVMCIGILLIMFFTPSVFADSDPENGRFKKVYTLDWLIKKYGLKKEYIQTNNPVESEIFWPCTMITWTEIIKEIWYDPPAYRLTHPKRKGAEIWVVEDKSYKDWVRRQVVLEDDFLVEQRTKKVPQAQKWWMLDP